MGLLFRNQLTHGQRKILIERVGIGLFGFVFALFGGLPAEYGLRRQASLSGHPRRGVECQRQCPIP